GARLACEADGKQGGDVAPAGSWTTLLRVETRVATPCADKDGCNSSRFPLLTIGLASEATLHGDAPSHKALDLDRSVK
ncbi:MAG: hypothetical protein WAM44_01235, partial [Chthoniobacterales bacterium]